MDIMISPLHKKNTKDEHLPTSTWGKVWLTLTILSLLTFSIAGWVAAFFFFAAFSGTIKDNPDYIPERSKSPKKQWVSKPKRPVHAWKDKVVAEPVAEVKTLAITNHARRNLALRHGVMIELTHLKYEELTPFEEEGEGCYIALFPEMNKSKKFAVFLDEDKSVIKTFCPHTDYNRNRVYFKKHTNLDNSLKDDMTKDLEFLQKVWLDKIA